METFIIYSLLCGQAQHQKGDICLDNLQHTVYYMEYLRAI